MIDWSASKRQSASGRDRHEPKRDVTSATPIASVGSNPARVARRHQRPATVRQVLDRRNHCSRGLLAVEALAACDAGMTFTANDYRQLVRGAREGRIR